MNTCTVCGEEPFDSDHDVCEDCMDVDCMEELFDRAMNAEINGENEDVE